jgi:DNA-binding IclR family transcriptional regulator
VSTSTNDGRYQVRALERGLAVLRAFDGIAPCMTANELSDKVGIPKPTLFRLLQVLVESGFVERSPLQECYSLGARALELGSVYLSSIRVPIVAQPILDRLAQETGETALLGVLQLDHVLILAMAQGIREINIQTAVGARYDPYCTALGKALLAGLGPDVQKRIVQRVALVVRTEKTITDASTLLDDIAGVADAGIAVEDEERERGIYALAAPVRDHGGAVVAAVGVMAPRFRLDDHEISMLILLLAAAAGELSQRLGGGAQPAQAAEDRMGAEPVERELAGALPTNER